MFGSTGTGRKGESEGTARLFLAKVSGFPDIWTTGLSSGEGLIERLRDPKDEDDSGGTDDKRLLVIESEFSSVMARTKREGSTLAAVLRQAWDGDALSVLNRSALTGSGSHVAVVGHVTPRAFCLRLAEIGAVNLFGSSSCRITQGHGWGGSASPRCCVSGGRGQSGDLVPCGESDGHFPAVLLSGEPVTA